MREHTSRAVYVQDATLMVLECAGAEAVGSCAGRLWGIVIFVVLIQSENLQAVLDAATRYRIWAHPCSTRTQLDCNHTCKVHPASLHSTGPCKLYKLIASDIICFLKVLGLQGVPQRAIVPPGLRCPRPSDFTLRLQYTAWREHACGK
jgi:hypothetical protein